MRRTELDWIRAVSMLGVVMIHASSGFIFRDSRISLGGVTPALFCNQATRFTVPLFFLLSGLSLGLSNKPVKLPSFWFRRLWKIGLPYVLWSLFYFLMGRGFRLSLLLEGGSLRELGWLLLLGGTASHLWFIPALLQLYLLYPLLHWLTEHRSGLTLFLSFLLTLFATLIITVPLPLTGWWRPHLWRMFPIWLFYFELGIFLRGGHLDRLMEYCRRHAAVLMAAGAAASFGYVWDAHRSGNLDAIKVPLFLYTPLILAALLALWSKLQRLPRAERVAVCLADMSMTVYFSHVLFLQYLRRIPMLTANFPGMLGLFLGTSLLSVGFSAALGTGRKWVKGRLSRKGTSS